jgi:hypothetical protein
VRTYCCLVLFLISTHFAQAQYFDEYFSPLECGTWGKPDWSKMEAYHRKKGLSLATGSAIRENDLNIRPLIEAQKFVFSRDEIYVRWLISDTTVIYKIKVTDLYDNLMFEMEANNCCGLKIRAKDLLNHTRSNEILVNIVRKKSSHDFGVFLLLIPTGSAETNNLSNDELIDLYVSKKLGLDALAVLENTLITKGDDSILVHKYWDVVNELTIRK